MKTNSFGKITVLSTAILFVVSGYAQSSPGNSNFFDKGTLEASAKVHADRDKLALETMKSENTRMFRDFSKKFKNASEILTNKDESNNTFIYCKVDGIVNRILYNKKGRCLHVIRTYNETELAPAVLELIKDNYTSFSIFGVTEVSAKGKVAYLVAIEDGKTWKIIRVVDNEFDVYKEYKKN